MKNLFKYFLLVSLFLNTISLKSQEIDSSFSVNFLSKLITIENYSGEEKPIFNYLSYWVLSQRLCYENLSSNDSVYGFIATLYPLSDKPLILFTAHMDVVRADSLDWKYPPFSGQIADGFIWGRGAIDDKGPLAMQLLALAKYKAVHPESDLPFNIGVMAVSSEEIGGSGASYIVEKHLSKYKPVAIFGEGGSGVKNIIPSSPNKVVFGISVTEKVPLWLMIESKARSRGHSSTSELYASKVLIKALIRIIDEPKIIRFHKVTRKMLKDLGKMEGGFKGYVLKHSTSYLFWPFTKNLFKEGGAFSSLVSDTYSITEINTVSQSPNSMPQQAYAYIDCRLLPGTSVKSFLFKLRLKAGSKVVITPMMQGVDAPPSEVNQYFDWMAEAIHDNYPDCEVKPYLFPASSDNNIYRAAGYPTYGITPIVVENELLETVHNSNERMPIANFLSGINVYYSFIENLKKHK